MNSYLKQLVLWLRLHKMSYARQVTVKTYSYDPTYGPSSYAEEVEIIDFDELLRAIDDFADSFKEEPK